MSCKGDSIIQNYTFDAFASDFFLYNDSFWMNLSIWHIINLQFSRRENTPPIRIVQGK